MNIKKDFPRLFKLLSRHFGARKAIKMIKEIGPIRINCSDVLSGCFDYSSSNQGHEYWANISYRIGEW
jgi:hypothetical protein